MQDQWKFDLESEDHRSRRDMTEKSIARYVKGETERQVTSSSTSSSVFVSDSTWVIGAAAAQPSYLCCGLSNGSVCLLNTSNLSKIYLFEVDRDARHSQSRNRDRRESGSSHRRYSRVQQSLVAVATHVIAHSASTSSTQVLLCVTLDSTVCVCPMDMSTVVERKKVSRSDLAKVKPYPAAIVGLVRHASVRFNPKGNCILAVLCHEDSSEASSEETSLLRYCIAVLTSQDNTVQLTSTFKSEREWHTLAAPPSLDSAFPDTLAQLCFCGWWSSETIVCVWSSSLIQLYDAAEMKLLAEHRVLRHCAVDAVTNATVSSLGAIETEEDHTSGLLVLVLEHNVVATFHVTAQPAAGPDALGRSSPHPESFLTVSVTPTLQTYCSEDIFVREVYLFCSFSWTVLVLLESGALVFLDAETMRLSVHRAVHRLRAPDVSRYAGGATLAAPRLYFCVLHGRPFATAIIEHNTSILLKSQ